MRIPSWAREDLSRARVGHLATSTKDTTPHAFPLCFAYDGEVLYSSIDEKPKRVKPSNLRRVLDISENDKVSFVVDSYSEDWRKLRYVILSGSAEIITKGPEHPHAVAILRRKYRQYRTMRIGERPIIRIRPYKVVAWKAE